MARIRKMSRIEKNLIEKEKKTIWWIIFEKEERKEKGEEQDHEAVERKKEVQR